MYVTPNGDILVSQSKTSKNTSPNNIILLRDTDGDGIVDVKQTFMSGLKQPLGMLVLKNWLYVGHTDGVCRYPYTPGQTQVTDAGQKILEPLLRMVITITGQEILLPVKTDRKCMYPPAREAITAKTVWIKK